jgi:bifunctional pyridoxal-dependent enzyme with beta-cystathionase and maltose regulon repressor activities
LTGYVDTDNGEPVTLSPLADEHHWFLERAITGMLAVAEELGDDQVNARPELPGANSAFGLVTHCLGVVEYWVGHVVAGRPSDRDRAAEFTATGAVVDLRAAVERGLAQLRTDLAAFDPAAPPRAEPDSAFLGPDRTLTQHGVLLHVLEELAQHHGQLEVLRDALRTDRAEPPFAPSLDWLRAKRGVKWHRPGGGVLPAWVADMDFPVAAPIRSAVLGALDRGDVGYPDWPAHPLAEPFAARMAQRFGWTPDPAHVRGLTDVIQGLQVVTELATSLGDGVVLTVPNYPPFLASVPRQGRRVVPLHLERAGSSWRWDLERLERELGDARLLLLVNPHNPSGRVFTPAELTELADFVLRHDLLVLSDEIHADLVHPGYEHVPFASLGDEIAARTVTLTSATKAFNIAGLRCAVAHVGPDELRARWDDQPPDLLGAVNILGVEATRAAWTQGDQWLAEVRAHLAAQRDRLTARLASLPVEYIPPEATYLAWLDWAPAALGEDAAAYLRRAARVELSPGPEFGGRPEQARLNFATSTEVLDEILARIGTAVERAALRS